jgi:LacI family transcriptional regulator
LIPRSDAAGQEEGGHAVARDQVTVHDVARRAGVSIATVSRALTGARRVTPEIADRVQTAAAELGYRPDTVARSLRRQETRTVGLVIADITNPFFPALVQAVEGAAREADLGVLFADAQNDPAVERDVVDLLLRRRVDALLISPCHRVRSRATLVSACAAVPVVQLDRFASTAAHYVGLDHDGAVVRLLDHLAATGRRCYALIGSDPSISTAWERQVAYIRRVTTHDPAAVDRVLVGEFSLDWGREATAQIMRRWPDVDAVVCANDLIAVGAVQELQRRGIAVPGRVAVTGFDDTLLAVTAEPALTSVNQPLRRMAEAAVALIGQAAVGGPPVRRKLPGELIVRASSADAGGLAVTDQR